MNRWGAENLCGKWGNVTFYMVFLAMRTQFNIVGYFHSLDLFFFVNAWQWQLGMAGNSNIPLLVGDAFYIGWENAVAFCYFWISFKFWWTLEPGNSSQCLPAIRKMW